MRAHPRTFLSNLFFLLIPSICSAIASTAVKMDKIDPFIPLIHIPSAIDGAESWTEQTSVKETSKIVIDALQKSGFLMITTPLLPLQLQMGALQEATKILEAKNNENGIVAHPTDPKTYLMLHSSEECQSISSVLLEYYEALQATKMIVLQLIALGLELDSSYFSELHDENNDTLRLIRYWPGTEETGNRCKEHSDYGTVTMLSTDGVSGLQAFHQGEWVPVPHVKGAMVVNIGSLLSGWTGGSLLATLHRVAGPASKGSRHSDDVYKTLLQAVSKSRTSIAFFSDPNEGVAASLKESNAKSGLTDALNGMSVAEYIKWRSGGSGDDRSGLKFTQEEEKRIQNST